jgi:hypothetical protein
MLQYNRMPLLDRVMRLIQICLRSTGRFSAGNAALIRAAGLLAALVLTALPVSPVLAVNSGGPSHVQSGSYQGQTIKVETRPASGVTKSSATLSGFLGSMGGDVEVYVWFELNNGMTTGSTKMTAPGPFSATVSGLASYTPYQFRAVAESPLLFGQKELGSYLPFHTLVETVVSPIVISTSSVSDITLGSAVLHGYLSSMDRYNEARVWLNWGPSSGFGYTAGEQVLYAPGPFSVKISGLSPNTRYYFRAGVVPSVGGTEIVYSTTDSFVTLGGGEIVVSTLSGINVTTTSATVTGSMQSMGIYSSANVWFQWGTTADYGQVTPMQTMYSTGIYTYHLKGLKPGTLYHFRALAISGSAGWVTARGFDNSFSTAAVPVISVGTGAASGVTSNSAVLSGSIGSFGPSGFAYCWFEYGTDTTYGSKTQQQALNTPGNFTAIVTGLSPGTAYYFRSAAFADGRPASGQYSTFSTAESTDLSITTREASLISPSSALLHAHINSTGSAPVVRVWFKFGPVPEYGRSTPIEAFTAAGNVSAQISGLIADTEYYFQAVAQAPDGKMTYGKQSAFRTAPVPGITVTTYPATGVTDSGATLNGSLDNPGNTALFQVWFEYGTTAEFGNVTIVKTDDSPLPFSSVIPVIPGTTYFYRAVAINPVTGGSPVPGSTISFITAALPLPPVVSPITSPFDWFIYGQRFVSIEVERILKSLNIKLN